MTDWAGEPVIRGFAEAVLARLPAEGIAGPPPEQWGSRDPQHAAYWMPRTAAFHGIVAWSPTIDPERLKLVSQEMLIEAGVRLAFHGWAAVPIVEDGCVRGALFESKMGRQAIRAKVVIDATGDGDMFARAGADFDNDIEPADTHHAMNTAFMLGGVDMQRWLDFRTGDPAAYQALLAKGRAELGFFQWPYVSWRNDIALFLGPRQTGMSALDVDEQTEIEVRSHRFMASHCAFFREHAPGFEDAFMLQSAPQLGVRHTRRLAGVGRVERRQWSEGQVLPDEIGVSPSVSPKFPVISVPYGALVPRLRPACFMRCQFARLPARDPAMLADRSRGGRRSGAGGARRGAAARCRRDGASGAAARTGRLCSGAGPRRGRTRRQRMTGA